jgi:dienelactone hydrolase
LKRNKANMQKLHVIYVPGLGDRKVTGQQKAINIWRHYGVDPELFQMNWGNKEPWEPKFERLLVRIDELINDGKQIGLVGVSAGASAVINAYAARKDHIVGVVCIAGKINRPETIGQHYLRNSPALLTSVQNCIGSLQLLTDSDRQHILTRYAVFDGTVFTHDSRIPGAHNRMWSTIAHVPTIAVQLTIGAPSFLKFLKKQR